MIREESTPTGSNPFYQYHMNARAIGRRYNQLAMIIHELRTKPDRKIIVLYPHEEACHNFISFAEANHVRFSLGEIEPAGGECVQQAIYGFEVIT